MKEDKSVAVLRAAKQAEETERWSWVEPSVWTPRMLAALEKRVKGGKWFSLIDKVYSMANLKAATQKVIANKGAAGVDHISVGQFAKRQEEELLKLQETLKGHKYAPQAIRRVHIPKPGKKETRPLGIPTIRDRIVQGAVRQVIEPIFEKEFIEHSYGFRPKRGCKDALRQVWKLLKEGYSYVVDADIKSYFDTIDHERLMELMEEHVSDGRVLQLIRQFLKQGVLDNLKYWTPERGTPQGGVISPLLANVYLDPLDKELTQSGFQIVRYADDLVILCKTGTEAQQALELMSRWTAEAKLTLHPEKTHIVDMNIPENYFEFLGYKFEHSAKAGQLKRWPKRQSEQRLRDRIRPLTRRCHGHSMTHIIAQLTPILRGWFEYYKHSSPHGLSWVDGWVRMRLRSILRKRLHKKGRGRGSDHQRWPNAYFSAAGLFSLSEAHAAARQSARG